MKNPRIQFGKETDIEVEHTILEIVDMANRRRLALMTIEIRNVPETELWIGEGRVKDLQNYYNRYH